MHISNTLAHLCLSKGLTEINRRTGAVKVLNSLLAHLDVRQGTVVHLCNSASVSEWVLTQQKTHEEALAHSGLADDVKFFTQNTGLGMSPMPLSAGKFLPMIYHPWREPGSDGQGLWLRACVMCPAMEMLSDYPAVAAQAMLWHDHVSKTSGLPMAGLSLHIPRLWLDHGDSHAGLPEPISLSVSPFGLLTPTTVAAVAPLS